MSSGTDERSSEASSVRSSVSGNDSLPGSGASSPRESPQPSSKSADGSDHPCKYFIMKAANSKLLQMAEQRSVWATTSANEKKITSAIAVRHRVLLLFIVNYTKYVAFWNLQISQVA